MFREPLLCVMKKVKMTLSEWWDLCREKGERFESISFTKDRNQEVWACIGNEDRDGRLMHERVLISIYDGDNGWIC